MPNRLVDETSPYLLQHADNPVDWHPWSPRVLERAREENRPLLLSIGYSACHWCHVMERESFEDEETAALMNRLFFNVKVDREERPDVDQIYMRAVQAMTGGGGWPLTVFLTPEGVPYYGGTYYPPEPRHGMPSFRQVLVAAANAWQERPEEVAQAGAQLREALERAASGPSAPEAEEVDPRLLDHAAQVLARRYDAVHGGFGSAPKFPQPALLELLLRQHLRTGEPASLEMAVHTLRRMADGGMRDHVGGGFHRYSVDARWLVPHFEKMLYDNALLARAYLDAWRITGEEALRSVSESTLDWILADMTSPEGGFYAARDADSEGEEGLFYVWTPEEVDALLGDDAALVRRTYDVSPGGNFEGRSILWLPHSLDAVARREGLEREELEERLEAARQRLLEARAEREAPFRDEKILVAWNGLTVRALAEAGAALGRDDYVAAAARAADFLLERLRDDGRLLHVFKDGRARIPAFLDDQGALANALLSLHGATLDPRWLAPLEEVCGAILAHHWSEEEGIFHDTADDAEALIVRPRDPLDMATPSGNSLAAEALWRAGRLLDEGRWIEVARRVVLRESSSAREHPSAYGRLLSVADRMLAEPVEVALVGGREDPSTGVLLREAATPFLRDVVLSGREEDEALPRAVPLLEGRGTVDGRPAAYVCRRYACRAPVTTPEALRAELGASPGPGGPA
jgi:hypothetical protein